MQPASYLVRMGEWVKMCGLQAMSSWLWSQSSLFQRPAKVTANVAPASLASAISCSLAITVLAVLAAVVAIMVAVF